MARVFPVPAPASKHTAPRMTSATARCSGSRPERMAPGMEHIIPAATDTVAGSPQPPLVFATWEPQEVCGAGRETPGNVGRDDVHNALVCVLPTAEESARPRGDRDRRGCRSEERRVGKECRSRWS